MKEGYPRIEIVRRPFALPPPPSNAFVVLDVAFAGGSAIDKTHAFIDAADRRLRLWVDHHEHPAGWARYEGDPRFVLVPSRLAHACPELVTPEAVERAGNVEVVLAHHDFDGLMSAVRFVIGGREPYPGADEDARAADAPGRGHHLSPRAERLVAALSESASDPSEETFFDLYRKVARSLIENHEPSALTSEIDRLYEEAQSVTRRAEQLAAPRRVEAPGVCVLRVEARLDGRMRRAVLSLLEEEAAIGLVLEGTPKRYWATAATYSDAVVLEEVACLDRGRHDFRFGATKDASALVGQLSSLARAAGLT